MECTQERLMNIIIKLPYIISQNDSKKLGVIPNVNPELNNLIINVGLWGLLPFVIGFVLLIIVDIHFCFGKGSKVIGKVRKVISLTMLLGVIILLTYSAVSVLEIKNQNKKLQKSYTSFVTEYDKFSALINDNSILFDENVEKLKGKVKAIDNSSDYKDLVVVTKNDFLKDVMKSLNDIKNPIVNIQDSLSSFNFSQYEDTRKMIDSTINKYIISTFISFYSIGAFFSLILMISLFTKKGKFVDICSGTLIFLALIFLILSIVLLGVPMILSVACPQIKPLVKNLGVPYVADIIDCDPSKPNPIMDRVNKINITNAIPQLNGGCVNVPAPILQKCNNVDKKLISLHTYATNFVNRTKEDLKTSLNVVFACDQLPGRVNEFKCIICNRFAKSLFQVGFFSSIGSILLLLFMFNIPAFKRSFQ